MQPRKSPALVLMQTKQPARVVSRSEICSGGVMVVPVLTKVSMVRRAKAGSWAASHAESPDGADETSALPAFKPLAIEGGSVSLDEDERFALAAESCATKYPTPNGAS